MFLFDLFGELGSLPFIYRGWAYLFSPTYRRVMREEWRRRWWIYNILDLTLTLIFMVVEIQGNRISEFAEE